MKIGLVLDDSLDKTDGVQQYVITVGKWLSMQGHEVHYLVGESKRTDIPRIHSLSKNLQVHFNQNRMSTPLPASKKAIRNLLEAEKFDVLHIQMPYSPFMAGKIMKLAPTNTAIVGTFHIIPYSYIEKIATKILRLMLWRSRRRLNATISVSKPAQYFAKNSFGQKSQIIPNPVHAADFNNRTVMKQFSDGKLNIVFLGRLVERKGCMYLLEAIQLLHEQKMLHNVRVIICGKGPLNKTLKSYVRDNHLMNVVIFKGFVSEEEKPNYLASADIAVFPSTGGESFGIVLVEAMTAGAHVVLAGNNIGYSSVITRKEQLIDSKNTKQFAKKLEHFIKSTTARRQAHNWQKKQIDQYDINIVGPQITEVYHKAVAKQLKYSHNKVDVVQK